ncbi:MAG: class I SAM-dependent methyltransferase [Candidatus Delongbacteria bacterium]|nr:class I SAM-dependent methyltransferase [Candidatus Delongbacteria bacterium]
MIIYCGLLMMALVITGYKLLDYRRRFYIESCRPFKTPLPGIEPESIDRCFVPTSLGYSRDCEVVFIGRTHDLKGGISDYETFILSVLAKKSNFIFEFGTCTGKTTYLLARNSPAQSQVISLTLTPDQHQNYRKNHDDNRGATQSAIDESCFTQFVYSGSSIESKITQIYCDSKDFDETSYRGRCDLIFIDGSHAYSYVKNDTEKAMRMIRPGGLIIWHDYRPKTNKETLGVYRYINELSSTLSIALINRTCMAVYRYPDDSVPD